MPDKTIFITGASNGIGKCLAALAKTDGFNVRTTGRSAGDIRVDLADADSPQRLAEFAKGSDIAVLNAAVAPGVGAEQEITINLTRQMQLAHMLLKDNPATKLAFVGSVISGAPIAAYPAYCAAKAGLAAFARALAAENPGQILLYHPSGTESKFMARAGVDSPGHLDSTEAVAGRLFTLLQKRTYPWRRPATWKAWAIDRAAKAGIIRGATPEPFAGGKTLITGVASGLGAELCRQGGDGLGLDVQAGGDWVVADLSQPAPLPFRPKIDRLINCAGITWTGAFTDMPYEMIEKIMAVNVQAPIWLEETLAPQQVVQISSLSHQLGYPYAAVYAASKSALAIWGQCKGQVVIYPGPMDTPQAAAARLGGEPSKAIADPAKVAAQILEASAKGKRQLVPGFANKALRTLSRIVPHIITGQFAKDQKRRMDA